MSSVQFKTFGKVKIAVSTARRLIRENKLQTEIVQINPMEYFRNQRIAKMVSKEDIQTARTMSIDTNKTLIIGIYTPFGIMIINGLEKVLAYGIQRATTVDVIMIVEREFSRITGGKIYATWNADAWV